MIYLVRHGETIWNVEGRQQGHLDSPLTPIGIEHSRAAGRLLRRAIPDAKGVRIETSPLGRAQQTATILSAELGIDASVVCISPLLIEHDLGDWQGLTWEEIEVKYPGTRAARNANKWLYVVPGGESYALIAIRAQQWLAIKRHESIVIAVTHEMLSRAIQGIYAGFTPAEILNRSHHHNRIYRLHGGGLDELLC